MTKTTEHDRRITRRQVLRRGAVSTLVATGALTAGASSVSAQQGGVAYLKEKHLYGKNNPTETRYKIVGQCEPVTMAIDCDSGRERTYARYQIRCPNYPGGGTGGGGNGDGGHDDGHDDVSAAQDDGNHDDGSCPGGDDHDGGGGSGGCGRHILVNPNRHVETSLSQLYEFVVVLDCNETEDEETYVKAAFKPVPS